MSSLVCGLDVHRNSVYATVMSYGGEVVEKRKLSNDEVVSFLGQYPIDKVAMEASTSIVPIYRALREKGYNILVSHPKKTRLIAESRIKTDRIDSWAVTELARLDALPLSYIPPDNIAALREKVRRRAFLDFRGSSLCGLDGLRLASCKKHVPHQHDCDSSRHGKGSETDDS